MAYSLDPLKDGCYENTSVLINKFDIRDEEKLDFMERSIATLKLSEALKNIPFKNVDFNFYKYLHKYVFEDIYEWAGQCRTVPMSKKGTGFCPPGEIEERGCRLLERLKRNAYLSLFDGDEFISEFTELYCSLNYLHPFREGNGRVQRLFLNMLLLYTGRSLDFSKVDKDLLMIATIRSVSGDIFLLREIFSENITSSQQ